MQYRDTVLTIPEIAKQLSVATILEGGVQRSGEKVRINVQLIDAHTDEHLWAEIYDRELTAENLFSIQSEISTQIADALKATLSPRERSLVSETSTTNLEASYHYMRGRRLMVNRKIEELRQAVEEFQQAVDIDPKFAMAWVTLADSIRLLEINGGIVDKQAAIERRRQAVDKALSLNDQLGEAYVSYGNILSQGGKRDESEAAYLKAIELAPNYAHAYHNYAFNLIAPSEQEQRLSLYYKTVQLDPMHTLYQTQLVSSLALLGRDEDAIKQAEMMLQQDVEPVLIYHALAASNWNFGNLASGISWGLKALERDPTNIRRLRFLLSAYRTIGDVEEFKNVRLQFIDNYGSDHPYLLNLELTTLLEQSDFEGAHSFLDSLSEEVVPADSSLMNGYRARIYMSQGEFQKVRDWWSQEDSRWSDPDQWHYYFSGRGYQSTRDCEGAGVLMATGDEALGRQLLSEAMQYMETEFPRLIQHTYRFRSLGVCYLVDGQYDKTFDFFSERIEHGHAGNWSMTSKYPWWNPVRDDPRFVALGQKAEEVLAEQRALLQQMETDN